MTNSLFSFRLDYETDGTYFDGNIRNQYWKSSIDGIKRAYEYSYDGASRLIGANFGSEKAGESYALSGITYDFNGNIKTLSRNGATNTNYTAFGNVDNLNYNYPSNSNKLSKIQDATTGNIDLGDFRDGTNSDDDYEYWLDGSLKKDKNKKIASITYNYLKLPEVITFDDNKTITTEYDAEGTKLKKIVSGGETTDYEEDDIYVNGVLYQTSHDEGRIVNGVYEYNINDHLGNLRVAFRDSLGIAVPTQSIFYDPWGLSMKGMQITRNPLNFNKFQFLNREIQIETGLVDLINRQYDPQRGQFTSIDPLAELSRRFSPFVYGNNNGLRFIDPDGMASVGADGLTNDQWLAARGNSNAEQESREENKDKDKKKKKEETKKSLPTLAQATSNGLNPNGDGIEVDYTLDGAYIGGKILKPLTNLFGKAWGALFGKTSPVVTSKVIANGVTMSVESSEGLIGGSFTYSNGHTVEFLANQTVSGKTLELTEMIFYPKGVVGNELKNEFGVKMMGQTFDAIKQYAQKQGFDNLRIQFQRAANSSSASPGKVVDKLFKLN